VHRDGVVGGLSTSPSAGFDFFFCGDGPGDLLGIRFDEFVLQPQQIQSNIADGFKATTLALAASCSGVSTMPAGTARRRAEFHFPAALEHIAHLPPFLL